MNATTDPAQKSVLMLSTVRDRSVKLLELPAFSERGVLPDTSANVQMEHSLFKHFLITGPAVPGAIVPSEMPGAIVEALFLSNDGDAAVLASPEGRDAIVSAYENAVIEYFEWFPLDDNA